MADQRQITSDAWNCATKFKRLDDKGNLQDYWKCHYCQEVKTGNVGRVEAHLGNVPNFGIAGCKGNVPFDVRVRMAQAANQKRENKKRKCISEQVSGMTTLGISSQIPNLGATNGSDEIYPGDAEVGGWSFANPQDHQQQIDGATENLTMSVAVDGKDWRHCISVYPHPNALQSGSFIVNNPIGGGGGGVSISNSEIPPHVAANDISSHSQITLPGIIPVYPGPAEMGGQSLANTAQGNTGNLSDVVWPQVNNFVLGNSQQNAIQNAGNIVDARGPELTMENVNTSLQPLSPTFEWMSGSGAAASQNAHLDRLSHELRGSNNSSLVGQQELLRNTVSMEMSSQRSNLGERWHSGPAGSIDAGAKVSNSMPTFDMRMPRSHLDQVWRHRAVAGCSNPTYVPTIQDVSPLCGYKPRSRLSKILKSSRELDKEHAILLERAEIARKQEKEMYTVNERRKVLEGWSVREKKVSKQCSDLRKELDLLTGQEDPISSERATQLADTIQRLRQEIKDLIKESDKFETFAVDTVVGFMKGGLDVLSKHRLKERALPVLLAY